MIADGDCIALFNSPTRVMKAEKHLRRAGLLCRLIPAPRQVADGCALALRFSASDQPAILKELAVANLSPRRLYVKQQGLLCAQELLSED
ncbi:hypothetical protein A7E78_09470 [Syntrophotalea acetylenivorans]|uniref:Putative Se/S carrier protein-like domain-containing protein n=1 Tax=Syntrophotalea acetylenivorans TaxID=1842532 RepID=A0A1L3GQ46_9BACT|nr:DUF3343 domain-containing protein [Syntrophotalea acetylenivorans]APG28044.1 hypothetical protein A7E78_09470 [Syntrophotalea acetylenivorans]